MSSLSFAQEASLILATFQLKAVQAVTGAIRAADLASGDVQTPSGIIEKPAPPAGQFSDSNREPVYEPRRHIQRDPVYTRRQVIHPTPRYERRPVYVEPVQEKPEVESCTPLAPSPIEPPWKVLPWMDRYPRPAGVEREVIKVIEPVPDSSRSGMICGRNCGLMLDILV